MYIMIGADQKEYGPATEERVREWIAEGRANGQTRIKREGDADWRTLSGFPEFEEALSAQQAAGTLPPPRVAAAESERLAAEILARDYSLETGDCIRKGWELVKSNFWLMVGAFALIQLLQVGLGLIPIVGGVASILLGGVFLGGYSLFILKLVRKRGAEIGDVFAGFRIAFVPLMLAGLVSTLLTGLGLLLCILPGIYLAVAWVFTYLLMVDRGLDFWPAMELSRKVVTKHWWVVFGLLLLNLLICLAGVLACLVGVFVAGPVACAAVVYAYEQIFTAPAAPAGNAAATP